MTPGQSGPSPNVAAALVAAAARLASASTAASDTARLDAEYLLAHTLGVDRGMMLLRAGDFAVPPEYAGLVARRAAGEPLAYITGWQDFWTVRLAVGPGALIPRSDSETLLRGALDQLGDAGPARILDLGTGPGTLLLAALDQWQGARGVGIDASDVALDYARTNAAALGLTARCTLARGDWHAPGWASALDGRFGLILANPPYIATGDPVMADVVAHEPANALFAGDDGLDDYRAILPALPGLLAPAGLAVVEIGWRMAAAVAELAAAAGLTSRVLKDLAGRDRALALRHDYSLGFGG